MRTDTECKRDNREVTKADGYGNGENICDKILLCKCGKEKKIECRKQKYEKIIKI